MRRKIYPFIVSVVSILMVVGFVREVFAEVVTQVATMEVVAENVFSIEFYKDANILFGQEGITFTNIDPTKKICLADGRQPGDGKYDTSVLCRTNMNKAWYLKISASSPSGFDLSHFKYQMPQAWNRTLKAMADGQLAQASDWISIPESSTTVYIAGSNDNNNLSEGTLFPINFGIDPSGLVGGTRHDISIVYSITSTP